MPATTPQPQLTRVAAYGLIVEQNRILLCRLSPRARTGRGQWTLPGGGIEFGESPDDGVVREAQEETGLQVRVGDLQGIDSKTTTSSQGHHHHIRIVYRAHVIGGHLRNEVNGSTDLCQWWPKADLPDIPLTDIVKRFLPQAF